MLNRRTRAPANLSSESGGDLGFFRRLWRRWASRSRPADRSSLGGGLRSDEPTRTAPLDGAMVARPSHWDQPLTSAAPRSMPPPGAGALHRDAVVERMEVLRSAFTPRQPKRWRYQFVGRARQIDRAIMAINDEQAHVVLYGDRGRGKTSLANVLTEIAGEEGHLVLRCAGSAEVTFDAIFRQLLQGIPADRLAVRLEIGETLASLLPAGSFSATELTEVIRHVNRGRVLMIIDEFDRIADPHMRTRLADAIKSFSDVRARVHLLIVGVASSLEDLLGAHPSIQRNVVGIHVPLMDADEMEGLIADGAREAGLAVSDRVMTAILDLSCGLPYCAQLFSLYAARNAVKRGSAQVEWDDFLRGAEVVRDELAPSVADALQQAAQGGFDVSRSLLAIARASSDAYGVFPIAEIDAALAALPEADPQRAIDWLASPAGGSVLAVARQSSRPGYVFANSIMRQVILLEDFIARSEAPAAAPTIGSLTRPAAPPHLSGARVLD